jgi:hypothetical protein
MRRRPLSLKGVVVASALLLAAALLACRVAAHAAGSGGWSVEIDGARISVLNVIGATLSPPGDRRRWSGPDLADASAIQLLGDREPRPDESERTVTFHSPNGTTRIVLRPPLRGGIEPAPGGAGGIGKGLRPSPIAFRSIERGKEEVLAFLDPRTGEALELSLPRR